MNDFSRKVGGPWIKRFIMAMLLVAILIMATLSIAKEPDPFVELLVVTIEAHKIPGSFTRESCREAWGPTTDKTGCEDTFCVDGVKFVVRYDDTGKAVLAWLTVNKLEADGEGN